MVGGTLVLPFDKRLSIASVRQRTILPDCAAFAVLPIATCNADTRVRAFSLSKGRKHLYTDSINRICLLRASLRVAGKNVPIVGQNRW
jgi:hypothetical protein